MPRGARRARLIEEARRSVAALVNAKPEHVVFTSGATEAASTLLTPDWQMGRGAAAHVRGSTSPRPIIPACCPAGVLPKDRVETWPVGGDGVLDLAALQRRAGRA